MAIAIQGYSITEMIEQTNSSSIYRAKRKEDGATVMIKALRNEYPSSQETAKLHREYEIAKKLDIPGVIKVLSL